MTSNARLLVTALLLAPLANTCRRASPAPDVAATEAPAVVSSLAAPAPPPPHPAGTAAPVAVVAAQPLATTDPPAPVTARATLPEPPPTTAAVTSLAPPRPAKESAATQPATTQRPAPQRPEGKITLPAKLGAVTFDHEGHAGKRAIACTTCHHPSLPQKPAASENQACRDCHTMPAAAPMKTSVQAAFHDPKGASGTCIDCHRRHQQDAAPPPVKCLQCHKKK